LAAPIVAGVVYGRTPDSGDQISLGYNALPTLGIANTVAIGKDAAQAFTTASNTSVIIGDQAAKTLTTSTGNTIIGSSAIASQSGTLNNATVIGPASSATDGSVILASGAGTVRFGSNNSGAWSYDGSSFGNAGEFLKTQGSGGTPVWEEVVHPGPTNYGTSGYYLTSNATKTPTWTEVVHPGAGVYGTAGQVLTSDGGSTPVWATPSSGAAGWTSAGEFQVQNNTNSAYNFSVPSTANHIRIVITNLASSVGDWAARFGDGFIATSGYAYRSELGSGLRNNFTDRISGYTGSTSGLTYQHTTIINVVRCLFVWAVNDLGGNYVTGYITKGAGVYWASTDITGIQVYPAGGTWYGGTTIGWGAIEVWYA
jgi:hypothetical protein